MGEDPFLTLFAKTPTPPYYAVIFTSQRRAGDDGYADMANALEALLHKQPGYLGVEHTRDAHGFGITVPYWRDLASISNWKKESTHLQAQHNGKSHWYAG